MTIRLLHYSPSISDHRKLQSISAGSVTYISPRNESQLNITLKELCERVLIEVKSGLKRSRTTQKDIGIAPAEFRDIIALWEEQESIAKSMLERLNQGDCDW